MLEEIRDHGNLPLVRVLGKRHAFSEGTAEDLRRQAWQRALAQRAADGSLPSAHILKAWQLQCPSTLTPNRFGQLTCLGLPAMRR